MWIPKAIVTQVQDTVRVFYVDRSATQFWNQTRTKGDPLVFTGWYWAKGPIEAGPFKSQSACYRDAWYHAVTKQAPPRLHGEIARREDAKQARANKAHAYARTEHRS